MAAFHLPFVTAQVLPPDGPAPIDAKAFNGFNRMVITYDGAIQLDDAVDFSSWDVRNPFVTIPVTGATILTGNRLRLTLASPLSNTHSVYVTYDPPPNTVQSPGGQPGLAFTNLPATF